MSEFSTQPEQQNLKMMPLLDHFAPALEPSPVASADEVGLDTNEHEAQIRAACGSARAMILRMGEDVATIETLQTLGQVEPEQLTTAKQQFEQKVELQFESIGLAEAGIVYDSEGTAQTDAATIANEVLDAIYPETEAKVLLAERARLLQELERVNGKLARSVLATKHVEQDEGTHEVRSHFSAGSASHSIESSSDHGAGRTHDFVDMRDETGMYSSIGRRLGAFVIDTGKHLVGHYAKTAS